MGLFDGNFGGMQGGNAFPGGQRPLGNGGNPNWAGGLQNFMQQGGQGGGYQLGGAAPGGQLPQGATNLTPPQMMPGGTPGGPPVGGVNNVGDWARPQGGPMMPLQGAAGPMQQGPQINPGGVAGGPPRGATLPQGATNATGIGAGGGFAGGLQPYVGQVGKSGMWA